jgi:hypothetical protein
MVLAHELEAKKKSLEREAGHIEGLIRSYDQQLRI